MAEIKSYTYSDINLLAQTGSSALVYDEDAVNQNILLILLTPVGSMWFDPTPGSAILPLLFEPVDDVTAYKIQKEISTLLTRNGETRVIFQSVNVLANVNRGDYYIVIQYYAPELDGKLISFDFNLSK